MKTRGSGDHINVFCHLVNSSTHPNPQRGGELVSSLSFQVEAWDAFPASAHAQRKAASGGGTLEVPRLPSQAPPLLQNQEGGASCALASVRALKARSHPLRPVLVRCFAPPHTPLSGTHLGGGAEAPLSRSREHERVPTTARASPVARRPRLPVPPTPASSPPTTHWALRTRAPAR